MSKPQSPSHDLISSNYASNRQTFIIPLTFHDINDARSVIERVSYGGDIWELRVDLLAETAAALTDSGRNPPSLAYVEAQVEALRSMSPLPILFTIRTKSQGGEFPDDAVDQALKLMGLAVDLRVEYIDVEIEWPQRLVERIGAKAKEKGTKLVASYHSWSGTVPWTGDVIQEKFRAADAFGDIIKLSVLSPTLEATYELGLFVRAHNASQAKPKPLLAVGMGRYGQLSRITSPISLVTHPLIPFPSAPGQLSLAQVHQAQYLMGILVKKVVRVKGENQTRVEKVKQGLEGAFAEIGFPYVCRGDEEGEADEVVVVGDEDDFVDVVKEGFEKVTGRRAPVSVVREI